MILRAVYTCLLLFVLYALPLRAQQSIADSTLMPIGECFTLRNGLSVRLYSTDGGPRERTEVRLAVRVGSAYEEEKEEGIAHFIEHMAFAPEWVMRTLAGYGNRYGTDFNAYTGYDRTVYSFSIPSASDTAMADALRVVRYWLAEMEFPRERVEQEKGVILREIADFEPEDPLSGAKLAGNPRYARFPIGRSERIRKITSRRLAKFYRRYYSPSSATLVVAGPIDAEVYRRAIGQRLGAIPAPTQRLRHPGLDIFASSIPSFATQPAGEDSVCGVNLFWPYRYGAQATRRDWLRNVCVEASASVLNEQLYRRGYPLSHSVDWYLNHEGFISLLGEMGASTRADTVIPRALGVLHGVSENCEQPQLFDALRGKALAIAQRAAAPGSAYEAAERMVGEALVEKEGGATAAEREWITEAIKALDTGAWRAAMRRVVPNGMPLVVHLEGCELSSEHMARAVAQGRDFASVPSFAQFIEPKINAAPARVSIPTAYSQPLFPTSRPSSREYFQSLDAHLYTLRNGVPLLTKRIRSGDSVVYIVASWQGGLLDTSIHRREKQEALYTLFDIGTVPSLSRAGLDSLMYQEGISQLFTISGATHRVMVACPPRGVALAMRLLRDRLLEPVWDSSAFASHKDEYITSAYESACSPRREMHPTRRIDAFTTRLIDPGFSVEEPDERVWQALRLEDLNSYFSALYARGEGLQIVAVGPVEGDTLAAAIAQSFDLPHRAVDALERSVPQLWQPNVSPQTPEEGAATFIAYWRGVVAEQGLRGALLLKLMRDALQDEVLRMLRMERQLVYSPFVSIRYDMAGMRAFALIVNGECSAESLTEAKQAAEAAVATLALRPLTDDRINGYRRAFLAAKDRDLTPYAATAWRDWLVGTLEEGATPAELDRYADILGSITPEVLRDAFAGLVGRRDNGFLALPLE